MNTCGEDQREDKLHVLEMDLEIQLLLMALFYFLILYKLLKLLQAKWSRNEAQSTGVAGETEKRLHEQLTCLRFARENVFT